MGDVLIRGLSEAAVARIDADAAARGLSRQAVLGVTHTPVTIDDLRRAAAIAADLHDPEIMDNAWR